MTDTPGDGETVEVGRKELEVLHDSLRTASSAWNDARLQAISLADAADRVKGWLAGSPTAQESKDELHK